MDGVYHGLVRRTGDSILDEASAEAVRTLAKNVRRLRLRQRLTQIVLADMAGINPRRLQKIEYGQGNTGVPVLARIASALDVPISALVDPPIKK